MGVLRRKRLLALVVVAIIVVAGVALVVSDAETVIGDMQALIRSWGMWGVCASLLLMILHSLVPFPAELVAIANGAVFGAFWGVVITWSGAMLGAFLAFGLARFFGRPFVEKAVAQRQWEVIDQWTAKEGSSLLLVGRLIPAVAFNLINYAAGLMHITWWTFAWTTGIGILPFTVLMVYLGDRMDKFTAEAWIGLGAVVAVLGVAFFRRYRNFAAARDPRMSSHVDARPRRGARRLDAHTEHRVPDDGH